MWTSWVNRLVSLDGGQNTPKTHSADRKKTKKMLRPVRGVFFGFFLVFVGLWVLGCFGPHCVCRMWREPSKYEDGDRDIG